MWSVGVPGMALFSLGLLGHFALSTAQHMHASPANFTPGLTENLVLSCNIHSLLSAVSDIFVLQIDKEEGGNLAPIATVTKSGVTINTSRLQKRVNATGNLDLIGNAPYLNVTLDSPVEQDSGNYICAVSVMDMFGKLVKLEYNITVTFSKITFEEMTDIISKLTSHVTDILEENKLLKQTNNLLTSRLDKLEINLQQEKDKNNQSDSDLEHLLEDLKKNISACSNTCSAPISPPTTVLSNPSTTVSSTVVSNKDIQDLRKNQLFLQLSVDYLSNTTNKMIDDNLVVKVKVDDLVKRLSAVEQLSGKTNLNLMALQAGIQVGRSIIAYAGTFTTGDLNQGSVTAATHMFKGDVARVKITQTSQIPITLVGDSCLFSGVYIS
ncbi:uncharacterized protein LOC106014222 [Aplysia californica]|uniref:Uncharacterized protein LOC106014222 n=1 Tax=Aplysia californica TaxID=6500 RepID=A0ABM1AG05_APLCA|nr:uncharacterized protein LOC106014222 [Aplysia californica]